MPKDIVSIERRELLSLLRRCHSAIELGFNFEGDVYGRQYNTVADTFDEIEVVISNLEKNS